VGRGSPLVDTDARAAALLRLMLEAIDLRLSELRYMAAEGGLSLEIVNHSFNSPVAGLRLALLGWAGRVETLLCDVVRAIAALEVRRPPPLLPSRTNWTRLAPPPVLIGHVSSLPP